MQGKVTFVRLSGLLPVSRRFLHTQVKIKSKYYLPNPILTTQSTLDFVFH